MAKESVEDRLIGLADVVVDAAKKKQDPELQIPVRALPNVKFNEKPSIVEDPGFSVKKCTADFILLIEKSTQFNRLSEDKFWKKHNCVLITGNGQPPRGVRRLCRRIHDEFKKPVYVLVDNDPWGYYI